MPVICNVGIAHLLQLSDLRVGACVGDSVVSVNVTFFSSHHLRYRLSLGAWQSLLRAAIYTPTTTSSVYKSNREPQRSKGWRARGTASQGQQWAAPRVRRADTIMGLDAARTTSPLHGSSSRGEPRWCCPAWHTPARPNPPHCHHPRASLHVRRRALHHQRDVERSSC